MKILIITKSYYPEKSIVRTIAEGLYKRGHNVTVLTAKPSFALGYILPGYQNISYELVGGVKVHRVDVKPRRNSRHSWLRNDYYFYKNSRKWVKKTKEKYDVVYSYGFSPSSNLAAGNYYKKKHKVPHIAHIVEFSPDEALTRKYALKYTPESLILYLMSRRNYKKVDELLVSSPIFETYVRKVMRLKKVPITYVPCVPLIERGIVNPYIYNKGFNIVIYENIIREHILNILPEAMEKVAREDIYFHIYGKGKLSIDLLEEINKRNLGNRIILHGDKPLNDIPNCFTNADACYFSMSSRGYIGKAINEKLIYAMAMKKPIIAVVDGDGAEVIKDSQGGFVIKDNVDDLVFAITKLASLSKKELEEKGNNNFKYFQEHFNIDDIIADIESVLLKKSL